MINFEIMFDQMGVGLIIFLHSWFIYVPYPTLISFIT